MNSASLQDTTLDEIFTLRSKLDQDQTRTSTVNLLNNQTNVDQNLKNSPSPCLQRRRYADDDINSSSFEALILDIDEATPYTSLCLDRGPPPQEDVHDFGFSVLPCGETYYRNKSSRRISPPSSHNSLRVVTRQNSEETKNSASGATLKFRSHLAIHKHEPINTSTGSSTSGVEISSLSSNSGIPNGATLPRMNSSSKLLYQPSYDPDDFLGPEDFENPLFIYRSLSFRRAIEEGNSTQNPNRDPQQHLSFVGTPSNAKQRALKECQQDSSSYFHVSQDSGHAQSLSLGSSLSIDGRFQAHLPSQSSLPLTDEPRAGAKVSLCYRPPSLDPFGSQDESIDRFVWKSFTSEDSGFDPIQILGTDLIADSSEDPFCRNSHLAVELRVSPGRRRCLSTLTEEELTEAMSSGPHQPTHPFPFPAPSLSRGVNSHQPHVSEGLKRPTIETKHLPAPLAVTINTSRRSVETTPSADNSVAVLEKMRRPEMSSVAKVTDATRPTSAAAAEAVVRVSDATQAKSVAEADGEDGAAEPVEKTSILIKAKRKSLHEMRHLQNITAAEEPLTECEESQQTTRATIQRDATSNDNNGSSILSSDKLHQVAEEPGVPDDLGDEPPCYPFPSLTDELLLQIAPKDDAQTSDNPEELSLQESEEKFTSLALAFKTDRETLDKRIELHLRARDVAEQNIQKELEYLKDGIKVLNQSCSVSPAAPQIFAKIQTHFDVLEKSVTRMSSRAEVHGAVQQELRVSHVIETMLEHVENLKRTYHTEHRELQEVRKSMNDNDVTETPGSSKAADRASFGAVGPGKGSLRRISLALMAKHPKLLRNTSLQQMSNSFSSSSPVPAPPPPLHTSSSLLFSNDYLENSCTADAITSRASNQLPQPNRRYSVNPAARNGDTRAGAEIVKKRRIETAPRGGVSKGSGGTSKEDGCIDVSPDQKPDSDLDQTSSQYHKALLTVLRRILMWLVALLRFLLQRSSKVSIRDGLSFLQGAISKLHPLKILPPGLIVILMFLVSAAALLVIIWTRWKVSQAIPTS